MTGRKPHGISRDCLQLPGQLLPDRVDSAQPEDAEEDVLPAYSAIAAGTMGPVQQSSAVQQVQVDNDKSNLIPKEKRSATEAEDNNRPSKPLETNILTKERRRNDENVNLVVKHPEKKKNVNSLQKNLPTSPKMVEQVNRAFENEFGSKLNTMDPETKNSLQERLQNPPADQEIGSKSSPPSQNDSPIGRKGDDLSQSLLGPRDKFSVTSKQNLGTGNISEKKYDKAKKKGLPEFDSAVSRPVTNENMEITKNSRTPKRESENKELCFRQNELTQLSSPHRPDLVPVRPGGLPVIPAGIPIINPPSQAVCKQVNIQSTGRNASVQIGNKTIIHGPVTVISDGNHAPAVKNLEKKPFLSRLTRKHWISLGISFLLGIAIVTTCVVVFAKKEPSTVLPDCDKTGSKIISRGEWFARKPMGPVPELVPPIPYVIITQRIVTCYTVTTCANLILDTQAQAFSNNLSDIPYNFLIGSDGNAYIGQGWTRAGSLIKKFDSKAVNIALLVTSFSSPRSCQISVLKKLLDQGLQNGYLTSDYKIVPLKNLLPTVQYPNDLIVDEIKKLPHYSNKTLFEVT